jgi:hypothetical protein
MSTEAQYHDKEKPLRLPSALAVCACRLRLPSLRGTKQSGNKQVAGLLHPAQ